MDEMKNTLNDQVVDTEAESVQISESDEKRPFVSPTLIKHGDFKDITKGGGGVVFSP